MKFIRVLIFFLGMLSLIGHICILVFYSATDYEPIRGIKVAGFATQGLASDPFGKVLLIAFEIFLIFFLVKAWAKKD